MATTQYRCSRRAVLQRSVLATAGLSAGLSLLQGASNVLASTESAVAGAQLAAAQSAFAFRLFARLTPDATTNTFISPLSVAIALAMTANGARGATQRAVLTALGTGKMSIEALNSASAALISGIEGRDPKVTVEIADSFWTRKGIAVRPGFARTLTTSYGAEVMSLDFGSASAPAAINNWVNQKTHGLIPKITGPIPPEVVLYLINAVYFHGDWTRPFAGTTSPQAFTLLNGQTAQVPMMNNSGHYPYYGDNTLQTIGLPYAGGAISMYVLLPAEGADFRAFLKTLNANMLHALLNKLTLQQGSIGLPRFSTAYGANLIPALSTLGMGVAFGPSADLSGMVSNSQAAISAVLHRAVIKVYESGTTAAAVTAVIGATLAMPQSKPFSMIVNRPFFLVIRDDTAGVPLFMGSIVDPR